MQCMLSKPYSLLTIWPGRFKMPFGGSACLARHSLEELGCCMAGSIDVMGPGRSREWIWLIWVVVLA